tara:strand:+ start:3098 stop:4021 length:924 start_codon:yes stop_codon:yes gene_type:complete
MAYLTGYQYYENDGNLPEDANWGSYQYVSLFDIVNNFMLIHQGNHELINNINRHQALFYAKRSIQELNYDALKEIKALELNVCENLRFVLPPDYVNWVRISVYKNGVLFPLSENIQVNGASAYLQDSDCNILFDSLGNILSASQSQLDFDRITGAKKSIYLNENSIYNLAEGFNDGGTWYFDFRVGARFGLNTETANANPTFRIDKKSGVINFSSGVANETVVLEYVSDGMEAGDDTLVSVNKMFEDYIYANIRYEILDNRFGVQEYVVNRAKKKRMALLRNARIRIGNINPSRLLMNLRGQNQAIK